MRSSSFRKEFDAVEAAGVIKLFVAQTLLGPAPYTWCRSLMVSGALGAVITI